MRGHGGCKVPRSACASSPGGWCAVALSTKSWNGTAVAAGAAETVDSIDVLGLEKWDRSRRLGLGEDAPFEELGKGVLRGGISERATARDTAVAGAMHDWGLHAAEVEQCASKAQLKKLRDRELRGSVSGGSIVWRRQRGGSRGRAELGGAVCVEASWVPSGRK